MNIKYFWINIDKSTNRCLFMEEQFKLRNIRNERINAITPDKLDTVLEDKPPFFCGSPVCYNNNCKDCKFEFSCSCSHLEAIKAGYKSGEDYFIVCEDDVYLPFKINFERLIGSLPEDFDIAQLMVLDVNGNSFLYDDCFKNRKLLFTKFDHTKALYSTALYLISRKGAKKFLNMMINKQSLKYDLRNFTTSKQADFLLYMSVNTYTCTFPLCFPSLLFISEIHPEHFILHKHAIDKIYNIFNDNKLMHPFITDYYPYEEFYNHYKALNNNNNNNNNN